MDENHVEVDPGELRLPPSRRDGVDLTKLAKQIHKHGNSIDGMPEIWATEDGDGNLRINNGVTRATRVHKIVNGGQAAPPGRKVQVEIIDQRPNANFSRDPKVSER